MQKPPSIPSAHWPNFVEICMNTSNWAEAIWICSLHSSILSNSIEFFNSFPDFHLIAQQSNKHLRGCESNFFSLLHLNLNNSNGVISISQQQNLLCIHSSFNLDAMSRIVRAPGTHCYGQKNRQPGNERYLLCHPG